MVGEEFYSAPLSVVRDEQKKPSSLKCWPHNREPLAFVNVDGVATLMPGTEKNESCWNERYNTEEIHQSVSVKMVSDLFFQANGWAVRLNQKLSWNSGCIVSYLAFWILLNACMKCLWKKGFCPWKQCFSCWSFLTQVRVATTLLRRFHVKGSSLAVISAYSEQCLRIGKILKEKEGDITILPITETQGWCRSKFLPAC